MPVSFVDDVDRVRSEATSDLDAERMLELFANVVEANLLVVVVMAVILVAVLELVGNDRCCFRVADCLSGNCGKEEREKLHFENETDGSNFFDFKTPPVGNFT